MPLVENGELSGKPSADIFESVITEAFQPI